MKLDKLVRRFGTLYVLCRECGMDMCWPSWCRCTPQRVLSAAEIYIISDTELTGAQDVPELLRKARASDDTTNDTPGDHGSTETPQTTSEA